MIKDIFAENIVLEDERVLLRPLVQDDYQFLLPFALNEPEIWKYFLQNPAGSEGIKDYIDTTLKNKAEKKEYPFIVFDKENNSYAGSTRFYDIQQQNNTAQLGYTWYGRQFQRTGLNRHCKFLLLQFAFEEWNMGRVEFRADANNSRSIEAMKAIGCTVEGILRSHMPTYEGTRRNSIVLSILQNEWFSQVKKNLQSKTR
jgi:RimJ/RimL family protein N-acetyltransferase